MVKQVSIASELTLPSARYTDNAGLWVKHVTSLSSRAKGVTRLAAAASNSGLYRMSKPLRFLLPLLVCLLSACATPRWVKPDASKNDLAHDQAACGQAVQQPPPSGTTDQQQYETCMNAHGWKLLHE